MNQPKTHFLHFRLPIAHPKTGEAMVSSRGGATVAYRVEDGKVTTFALAKCHIKDNFRKSTGRAKAGGRLNSPNWAEHLAIGMDHEEFVDLMKHIFPEMVL